MKLEETCRGGGGGATGFRGGRGGCLPSIAPVVFVRTAGRGEFSVDTSCDLERLRKGFVGLGGTDGGITTTASVSDCGGALLAGRGGGCRFAGGGGAGAIFLVSCAGWCGGGGGSLGALDRGEKSEGRPARVDV